jgi:hypothetical protein
MIAVGVARPIAHGQAMMSTLITLGQGTSRGSGLTQPMVKVAATPAPPAEPAGDRVNRR